MNAHKLSSSQHLSYISDKSFKH